jgi:cytochrome c-type biogenesis protein CcmE
MDGGDTVSLDVATPPTEARPSKRRKMRWSFLIAGLAIAGAVIYLVVANTQASAAYYMTVKELRACTSCADRTVRVAGIVAPGTIQRTSTSEAVKFTVADGTLLMPVVYNGIVPDVFKDNVQVVVEGKLQNGVFRADNLLAKCPSKFQAATPGTSTNPSTSSNSSGG